MQGFLAPVIKLDLFFHASIGRNRRRFLFVPNRINEIISALSKSDVKRAVTCFVPLQMGEQAIAGIIGRTTDIEFLGLQVNEYIATDYSL